MTRALDSQYQLDDTVFLGFDTTGVMPKHGDMNYRTPRVVCVAPDILYLKGVKIALGRANHARTEIFNPWRAVHKLDLDAMFTELDPTDINSSKRLHQASHYEVLVPTSVPPEYIIGVQ